MAKGKTGREIITKVSRMLADQEDKCEFTTWTEEDLVDYLNDGLCQILATRPDAFASVENITLTAGDCQKLGDEYYALLGINGAQAVSDGETTQNTQEIMQHFRRKMCAPTTAAGAYAGVNQFTVNIATKVDFTIDPPVPSGQTAEVKATVARRPDEVTKGNLDESICLGHEYNALLCDWMLHRAFSVETEGAGNREWANFHYRKFYDTFNVNYLQGQRFGSGFYLGREGEGDERFRSR